MTSTKSEKHCACPAISNGFEIDCSTATDATELTTAWMNSLRMKLFQQVRNFVERDTKGLCVPSDLEWRSIVTTIKDNIECEKRITKIYTKQASR